MMYPEPAVFKIVAKDPILFVTVIIVFTAYDQNEINQQVEKIKTERPSLIIERIEDENGKIYSY